MSNSFSWNTTIPVEQKPILVYIFRCSAVDGEDFEYSSELESRSLGEEKVRRLAREFICEKVCLSDEEFLREVEGREAVSRYLETLGKPEERRAHLALLDFQGNALATIDEKGARRGAKVMAAEMRGCLEENARRAAEFQVQGDS